MANYLINANIDLHPITRLAVSGDPFTPHLSAVLPSIFFLGAPSLVTRQYPPMDIPRHEQIFQGS